MDINSLEPEFGFTKNLLPIIKREHRKINLRKIVENKMSTLKKSRSK